MNEPADKLERLLRDDARSALPDDGFTARVLGSLPPALSRPFPWLRSLLVLGSAALGSVLAIAFVPEGASLMQGFVDLAQSRLTPAALTGLAMCGALFLSAVVLAADTE